MSFASADFYIASKGGRFQAPDSAHSVLHEIVNFAASHSGRFESQPGHFLPFEVVISEDTSTRATGIKVGDLGIAHIPIGVVLRSILALNIFRSHPLSYETKITVDPKWHDHSEDNRTHHPLVSQLYGQTTFDSLFNRAQQILNERGRNLFEPILWHILKLLICHEKVHLERHDAISAAIDSLPHDYRRRELSLVRECDADCYAVRSISHGIFQQMRHAWPDLASEIFSSALRSNFQAFGTATFIAFTLMIPNLRSITAYDIMPYAHPQVRVASMANFIGKEVERLSIGCRQLSEKAVQGFINGVLTAVSGYWTEREFYNDIAIEIDPSFDSSQFRPITSMSNGRLAQRQINDRAIALMNQRIAYLDDDEELWPEFQREPPINCECSFLDITRSGIRFT